MPFKSLKQNNACFASHGFGHKVDCEEWAKKTDYKHLPKKKKSFKEWLQIQEVVIKAHELKVGDKIIKHLPAGKQEVITIMGLNKDEGIVDATIIENGKTTHITFPVEMELEKVNEANEPEYIDHRNVHNYVAKPRSTKEYHEGFQAYPEGECPYEDGSLKSGLWLRGWSDCATMEER